MRFQFTLLLLFFLCLTATVQKVNAQKTAHFGAGYILMGTGDMSGLVIDTELDFELSRRFSVGGGLAFAKTDSGVFEQASFFRLNSLLHYTPFGNATRNRFRLAAGPAFYSVSDVRLVSSETVNGVLVDADHVFESRTAFGWNFAVEDDLVVSKRLLLGLKLFFESYASGDVNVGALVRVGYRL